MKKVYIKTFGCAQNTADSERIKAYYWDKGYEVTNNWKEASVVVINSCVIRESAENRVYGLVNNIDKFRRANKKSIEVVVSGCLVGTAAHSKDKERKMAALKRRLPQVDRLLPISEIGFNWEAVRDKKKAGLVIVSNGCNNFCSYCIVPSARGAEISRPMEEILSETDKLLADGFKEIVLVGQNVNSYGSDLVSKGSYVLPDGTKVKAVMVKHMGKQRIPTLFPHLLAQVAKKQFEKVSFVSSNPWDFSDELIEVIAQYPNIDRVIHLPLQAGDDGVLKNMNRNYTAKEYVDLTEKIKSKVEGVKFTTDIIIGFPGEDEQAFEQTVEVCRKVGFSTAYLNKYSPRPGTVSAKLYQNTIPQKVKKERWKILDELINSKN